MDYNPEDEQIRCLPCTILPDDQLWCLCGEQVTETSRGGGILEWCYSEQDARNELARLWFRKDLRNLRICKYK